MITYLSQKTLREFDFWSGGEDRAKLLTLDELEVVENWINETGSVMTETEINDMFWFDFDTICEELLGLDPETVYNRK
jgi:L-rhamnose mutarotase